MTLSKLRKPVRGRRVPTSQGKFEIPFAGLTLVGYLYLPLAILAVLVWVTGASAQAPTVGEVVEAAATLELAEKAATLTVGIDTMWVLLCAFLVIFMNAGFAMVETGFCRQKNAVNILTKNLVVFAVATLAFWLFGFGLMFGDGSPIIGTSGFLMGGADNSPATGDDYEGVYGSLSWTGVPLAAKFLFQVAFAGTAATIVSGSVAERVKFIDFLIFSFLLVGVSYAVTGHWIWGGGWLAGLGFWDFAGSTVVHSVGGWAALMGAALLGPRLGKYTDSSINAIPGHNLSIATLGCLILWLGWFGFNPGSTMAVGDGFAIAHIAVTTNLAAAAGGIAATIVAWVVLGKPDLSMIVNGILAGLVGITAGCAFVTQGEAMIIGAVAGVLVVFSVLFFDKIKIDDPVGAVSVHLVNGIWGTLAIGLFAVGAQEGGLYGTAGPAAGLFHGGGITQLVSQAIGVVTVGGFTVVFSVIVWMLLKAIFGLRVPPEEEMKGLDVGEHGMEAYAGFVKEEG
ncbi:MAG: ammonium transporter [Gloeomargaritaceae cyanobacterium C42_A2020_066]|nr:ammonium transporter [Gloeomargaritaceae cyanobacterium C42_A2020_066]